MKNFHVFFIFIFYYFLKIFPPFFFDLNFSFLPVGSFFYQNTIGMVTSLLITNSSQVDPSYVGGEFSRSTSSNMNNIAGGILYFLFIYFYLFFYFSIFFLFFLFFIFFSIFLSFLLYFFLLFMFLFISFSTF